MRRLLAAALGMFLGVGCTMGPDYKRPPVPAPATFRGQVPDAPPTPDGRSLGDLQWWEVFQDPELQSLVRRALVNNFDLRLAVARVLEARARLGVTRADQFPQVSGTASVERFRNSRNAFPVTKPPLKVEEDDFLLGGSLSYEIDLWGRLRRATEAARAQLLASEATQATVTSTLLSQVATAYLQLRELDLELEISQRTLVSRQASLRLVKLRRDSGVASGLDIRQAEVLVNTAAATIPDLQRQIEQTENQITLLLGESPGDVARGLPLTDQVVVASVPAGLPSALLERRPDIREAEQQLVAANANIGAAKALFFPQITLTVQGGVESAALARLFEGPSGFWAFSGQLLQPIFQGGRIWFNFQATKARQQQALITYQQSIQSAFRDVSDALVGYRRTREFRVEQEALTNSLREYSRLSTLRYRGGVASYLEVLDADTKLFSAELDLAKARREELLAGVQLYRALGGGWRGLERPATQPTAERSVRPVAGDQNPATYGSLPAVASIAAPASRSTAVESHVPPTS
jgi:multidrug efflux system outer membrane protein